MAAGREETLEGTAHLTGAGAGDRGHTVQQDVDSTSTTHLALHVARIMCQRIPERERVVPRHEIAGLKLGLGDVV